MTGQILRMKTLQKLHGFSEYGTALRFRVDRFKVESSYVDIRTKPTDYIGDTFMRAAAKDNAFPVFFYQKELLMEKIVRHKFASVHTVHPDIPYSWGGGHPMAADQLRRVVNAVGISGKNEPGVRGQGNIKPNIAAAGKIRQESIAADINRRMGVAQQKCMQSAPVVIMSMRDDCTIRLCQIYAQFIRILCK